MKQFEFKDVFGVEVGERIPRKVRYPDRTTDDWEILFDGPMNSEDDIRFAISVSGMIFGGGIELQIVDKEDNDRIMYTSNVSIGMFCNLDGIDPRTGDPTGHKNIPREPRETHIYPGHKYAFRAVRPRFSLRQPLGIWYSANDKDEIQYTAIDLMPFEETVDGFMIDLGPLGTGVFLPD